MNHANLEIILDPPEKCEQEAIDIMHSMLASIREYSNTPRDETADLLEEHL